MAGLGLLLGSAAAPAVAQVNLLAEDPLITAVRNGDAETIRRMMLRGERPDRTDGAGRTALMLAIGSGYTEIAALLIGGGAVLGRQDQTGNHALSWAADRGDAITAERLIENDAPIDRPNRQGMTPLMLAARGGHAAIVGMLLTAGADPWATDYTGADALYWARESRSRQTVRMVEDAL